MGHNESPGELRHVSGSEISSFFLGVDECGDSSKIRTDLNESVCICLQFEVGETNVICNR